MLVVLIMFRADGERRSFSVVRDLTVIGRREDCDLRIPLGEVSRKHCRIIREQNSNLRLEDLGSSNGTYHNGNRVQEAILKAGDTIQVGPVVFLVQIDGKPSDEQIQSSGVPAAGQGVTPSMGEGIPTEYTPPATQQGDGFAIVDDGGEVPVEDIPIEWMNQPDPDKKS